MKPARQSKKNTTEALIYENKYNPQSFSPIILRRLFKRYNINGGLKMNYIKIIIPGIPASKGSFNRGKYGQLYPADKKLRGWVNAISWQARSQAPRQPSQAAIELTITFNLPHYDSNKDDQPTIKPDLDKLARAVLDALTGIIYHDDSQVIRLVCSKAWAIDAPGCQIEIREALLLGKLEKFVIPLSIERMEGQKQKPFLIMN
jgi:Holliday junction resolvase RusA-like endonuclease